MNMHRSPFGIAYGGGGRQGGAHTPRTLNSLTAIDGQEGEEEDWERDMRDLRDDDGVSPVHICIRLSVSQILS